MVHRILWDIVMHAYHGLMGPWDVHLSRVYNTHPPIHLLVCSMGPWGFIWDVIYPIDNTQGCIKVGAKGAFATRRTALPCQPSPHAIWNQHTFVYLEYCKSLNVSVFHSHCPLLNSKKVVIALLDSLSVCCPDTCVSHCCNVISWFYSTSASYRTSIIYQVCPTVSLIPLSYGT